MKSENKRLFINNLENNVTEDDIRNKFSDYGTVTSIEIKERKNPTDVQTQYFAYININAEDFTLNNCIEEFARKKWKGQFLNLQVAKESFIEKLKREREQNDVTDSEPVVNGRSEIKPININISKYQNRHDSTKQAKVNVNKHEGSNSSFNQDNEKRLKSLMHMKEGYRQQKLQIKNALSNIDKGNAGSKIRFDHIDGEEHCSKAINRVKKTKNKMLLFDEAEDDDKADFGFREQPQFDGVKGQKLLQLQSRFKNDDRFKLDSRFVDEEEQNIEVPEVPQSEKERQLEILESVLGQKLKRQSLGTEMNERKKAKMMFRFDPSQPQHSKFELQQEIPKEVKRKTKEKKTLTKVVEDQPPLPEVSKETFYTVTTDLKDTLYEKEGFSLSKLFSSRIEQDMEKVNSDTTVAKPTIINKKQEKGSTQKVFKYDSSDDEEEVDTKTTKDVPVEVDKNKNSGTQIKPRMWTETFFFKDDDYRLQEGFDFIKRLQLGEQENFAIVRKNLKQIVRAKVKNNLRKNGPFKRKLGGNKKRLKIKRALKR